MVFLLRPRSKRRFHSEGASNVFRPDYTGGINVTVTEFMFYKTWSGKSPPKKSSVFKMFLSRRKCWTKNTKPKLSKDKMLIDWVRDGHPKNLVLRASWFGRDARTDRATFGLYFLNSSQIFCGQALPLSKWVNNIEKENQGRWDKLSHFHPKKFLN